jgi:threonyl-tRNA synthetase
MLVIGRRDVEAGVVSVRKRGEGDLGAMAPEALLAMLIAERDKKL